MNPDFNYRESSVLPAEIRGKYVTKQLDKMPGIKPVSEHCTVNGVLT